MAKTSSSDGIALVLAAVFTIIFIVPWLLIKGIVFIFKAIASHSKKVKQFEINENAMQHLAEAEEKRREENLPKVQELIQKTNASLDRYEQQIAIGQDKYQIGRAIGRLCFEFQEEFSKLNGSTYNQAGRNPEIDALTERIDAIANSDIQIENGIEDFRAEQNRNLAEQRRQQSMQEAEAKREREREQREREKLAELKKQTELKEKIAANSKCAGCRRKDTCWKMNNKYCGGPF